MRSSVLIDFASVTARQTSSTRLRLLATLRALGYAVVELLITPLQFGIPNSRLRYYLLAKASPLKFSGVSEQEDRIWRHIPGSGTDWADPRTQPGEETVQAVTTELCEYLDEITGADPPPHAVSDKVLEKWGRLFDIVLPSARRTCCFTRGEFNLDLFESSGRRVSQSSAGVLETRVRGKCLQDTEGSESRLWPTCV